MLKTFSVLFVLGLALGLWVGFNPQSHEKTIKRWDEAHASFITVKANVSDAIHNWTVNLKSSGQTGNQKITIVWKQVSSIFTTIWDGVRRIWTEITFELRTIK